LIRQSKIANLNPKSGCGSSSVGRASAFQAECREFESRLPLQVFENQADRNMPCKEDINQYNRVYYQHNREHLLKKQAEKNKRFAENRRKWLVEYKKTLKCVRCAESHLATLTFHHKDNSEKSFEIGNAISLGISLKRLLSEIEKCEVLCANCHAKEHLAHLYQ
jgi:hypothetical protein